MNNSFQNQIINDPELIPTLSYRVFIFSSLSLRLLLLPRRPSNTFAERQPPRNTRRKNMKINGKASGELSAAEQSNSQVGSNNDDSPVRSSTKRKSFSRRKKKRKRTKQRNEAKFIQQATDDGLTLKSDGNLPSPPQNRKK